MHIDHEFPFGLIFLKPQELDGGDLEGAALPLRSTGIEVTGRKHAGKQENEFTHGAQATNPGREWFCNAEFDLTLAGSSGSLPSRLLTVAREMAWQLWPALSPQDRLRVPVEPSADYLEYLSSLGLELPTFGTDADAKRLFTPFGWNREAAAQNLLYDFPVSHPDPAVVARVNSREFTLKLEEELFPEQVQESGVKAFCGHLEDLEKWLADASASSMSDKGGRWVAKGNHGHAGIGQMRFAGTDISDELIKGLKRILETQGGLLLEPEQAIQVEYGCLFYLERSGVQTEVRCHQLRSYSGGGFAGALYAPQDTEFLKWKPNIEKALTKLSHRLHLEGYFGPVSVDAYAWKKRDSGEIHFRPLVDLNARCSMAYPVHGLSRRFPDRTILMTQIPSTLSLPKDSGELRCQLSELQDGKDLPFDPITRRGVFLVTPLMPGPRRHAWACIGLDEADVRAMREKVFRGIA
jgi:hypothetical protein